MTFLCSFFISRYSFNWDWPRGFSDNIYDAVSSFCCQLICWQGINLDEATCTAWDGYKVTSAHCQPWIHYVYWIELNWVPYFRLNIWVHVFVHRHLRGKRYNIQTVDRLRTRTDINNHFQNVQSTKELQDKRCIFPYLQDLPPNKEYHHSRGNI